MACGKKEPTKRKMSEAHKKAIPTSKKGKKQSAATKKAISEGMKSSKCVGKK